MEKKEFYYRQSQVTWTLLFGLAAIVWTVLAIADAKTNRGVLAEPGFWLFPIFALCLAILSYRFLRARIAISHDSVDVYKVFTEKHFPTREVVDFELVTGRFGVMTYFAIRTSSGTYRTSLNPWQNQIAALRSTKVVNFLKQMNSTLTEFK